MKIVKIEWQNIFSYGNTIECIEFDDDGKLWQLSGKSGSGKTSLLTIPKLLFFGKTEGSDGKPFKVGAIANRANKHGWIKGTVRKGNDEYVIERCFSPQSISVFKNGENIDKAGLKNIQEIIETEILDGLPYNIFSNVLTLSLNNFKSFISMTPADKRLIIDRIFSLEIINKIYELIKKDMKELGNAINNSNSQIFSLNNTIKMSTDELERMKEKKSDDDADKLNELRTKMDKVAELYKQYSDIYTNEYSKYTESTTTLNQAKQVLHSQQVEYNSIQQKINLFNEDKCPTCGTSFNSSEFVELKEKLMNDLNSQQSIIDEQKSHISDLERVMNDVNTGLVTLKGNLDKLIAKQNELKAESMSITNSMNRTDEYESIQRIINETNAAKESVEESVRESNHKMSLLNIMESLYSVDGIKQKMMNNYIPVLNKELGETLLSIGFPYTMDFDNNFDAHLHHIGIEIEPQTLSVGEHKKVDLAVLCSILKMIKRKYPQINLICLDETVSSLDYESSTEIIKYLKSVSVEMGLNIFIVSHTQLDENLFDKHILVEKSGGFSKLIFN